MIRTILKLFAAAAFGHSLVFGSEALCAQTNTSKNTTKTVSGKKTAAKTPAVKNNVGKGNVAKTSGANKTDAKKGKSGNAAAKTASKGKTSTSARKTVNGKKTSGSASSKIETSEDVRKRREATQKEIRLTEQQIRENEAKVKNGLNELGKLEGDITVSKNKIAATASRIADLSTRISELEKGIIANETELHRLRSEYLKAVKKMRIAGKGHSTLSFIFASDNFNQALRRMRYLRQFSEWKDRQLESIGSKTEQLKSSRESLAMARSEQDEALKRQKTDQSALEQQYSKQDAIVEKLKQNGTALKTHLSKKQKEANDLNNKIAALIAEEQRKAEEARRAEEARKAAEEKARLEAVAKAQREAEEREANDKLVAEQATKDKDVKEKLTAEQTAKEKTSKDTKEKVAKDTKEKVAKEKKSSTNDAYANARKRKPRGDDAFAGGKGNAASTGSKSGGAGSSSSATASGKGDFASMKGSLPRPVSGAFKVTSRFGRQSLPDLPDIVYDNPGIDAEVAAGASATAVYGGKVSGVYVIPGYNTVVIVNHGNYYTVYGNINSPAVKVGDPVRAGQDLGVLAPDEDNHSRSSVHFEVWRNREKLNPLDWIRL